jgi:ribonuclease HI
MIASQGMIRLALAMLSLRSLRGETVKIVHVRGHSGDPGNEGADYLARMGATKAVVDDYDWDMMREAVEKEKQDVLESRRTAVTRKEFQVLLEVCHLHTIAL